MNVSNRSRTNAVVIGTGISGLTVSLTLARQGLDVILVTKTEDLARTNTSRAQGGIIFRGKEDSAELLTSDILRAGAGIVSRPAAEFLALHGPEVVESLLIRDLKVPFDTTNGGDLHFTEEGAHAVPRIIHVADYTGKSIEDALLKAVLDHENITILQDHTAIDILTTRHHTTSFDLKYNLENQCVGVYLLDNRTKEVITLFSDSVVLATGGVGHLYNHTTNVAGTIGSGLVMAHRAGAYLLNTEYIQFHPTALYIPGGERFLISESLRGEGARLKTLAGDYFMKKYAPEREDLAPRDVVARAIMEEMTQNHQECVYLDLAGHYNGEVPIAQRFPTIHQKCLGHGIDISRDLIPVVPAAHYFCGGVVVDLEGKSTINRLYAVGEVACSGVHGANRLASTSLLEGLTWGYYTALGIGKRIKQDYSIKKRICDTIPDWHPSGTREDEDPALILQDWMHIRSTMWHYVGITRTRARLERAVAELSDLSKRLTRFYHETRVSKPIIGLFQGIVAAQIIAEAALRNTRSRGAHYRKT